ncbi:MAG TPA: DUF6230 family protein [Kineosporiaceae bacterium]|nr:DUF6230 family protein [Kineosporiaceae bacterium]
MQDRHARPAHGRTRWRRFAAVTVPSVIVTGGIMFGMANGAIAASFAVSGDTFKVSADELKGNGFAQYGSVDHNAKSPMIPVAVAGINNATSITNMCQSVKVPVLGVSVVLRAGTTQGKPATATGLMFDLTSLKADTAVFGGLDIGRDASTLSKGGAGAKGAQGGFGQEADSVTLTNVKQVAWSASAGTFTLPDLNLQVDPSGGECF